MEEEDEKIKNLIQNEMHRKQRQIRIAFFFICKYKYMYIIYTYLNIYNNIFICIYVYRYIFIKGAQKSSICRGKKKKLTPGADRRAKQLCNRTKRKTNENENENENNNGNKNTNIEQASRQADRIK